MSRLSNFLSKLQVNNFYLSLFISAFLLEVLFLIGFISFKPPGLYLFWTLHIVFLGYAALEALKKIFILASETGKFSSAIIGLSVLWIASIALIAFPPITARDALIYHLYVPKLWLAAGHIAQMPWLDSSYFSLLISVAYAGFISLGLDRLTPYYHLLYLPISAALISDLTERLGGDRKSQLVSALLVLTTPIFSRLASEPMADLVVVAFFSLAFILLFKWADLPNSKIFPLLSGLAIGFALSSKYTAILAAGFFPALFLFVKRAEPIIISSRVKAITAFVIGGVISYGPWIGRNIAWTGNPVYPFLSSVFGDSNQAAYIGEMSAVQYRMAAYGESWLQFFLLPLRMVLEGKDGSTITFDGQLTLIFLLLPLVVVPFIRKKLPKYFIIPLLVFIAAHLWAAPILHHALIRYQAAVSGPIIGLIAIAACSIFDLSKIGKIGISGLFLVHLSTSALYLLSLSNQREAIGYIASGESSSEYLRRQLDEFSAAELVNGLPKESKVYLIHTGNKFYLYPRDIYGSYFSTAPISEWLASEQAGARFLPAEFRQLGITHLLAHRRRLSEVLQAEFRKNPELEKNWAEILATRLVAVGGSEKYVLWKVQ